MIPILDWQKALAHLGMLLDAEGGQPVHLIVAGGAALLYQDLVKRTTRDIDVIGLLDTTAGGEPAIQSLERIEQSGVPEYRLPENLNRACLRTARDLGLTKDWINVVAADVVRTGLPEGTARRLHTEKYSRCLWVSFLDRADLIPLKLHAALDRGGGRHLDDLRRMAPTTDEIARAAAWCLAQDSGLRLIIKGALTAMGFADALDRLDL